MFQRYLCTDFWQLQLKITALGNETCVCVCVCLCVCLCVKAWVKANVTDIETEDSGTLYITPSYPVDFSKKI